MATGEGTDRVAAALRLLLVSDVSTCGYREVEALRGALQTVDGYVSAFRLRLARRSKELTSGPPEPVGAGFDRDEPASSGCAGGDGTSSSGGDAASNGGDGSTGSPGASTLDGLPLDVSDFAGVRDRRPGRAAEQDHQRARTCQALPVFEAALAAGRIDAAHVDAVAAVMVGLDESEVLAFAGHADELVTYAGVESPERFRRRARDLARRISRDHGVRRAEEQRQQESVRQWTDRHTGLDHFHVTLAPENAARVRTALDQQLAELKRRDPNSGTPIQRLEVDAFIELVTSSTALDPRAPELVVLIDLATLQSGVFGDGAIAETADGAALTPAAIRRLACDAEILPAVLGGDGRPLDVGRSRRLATRDQRRALAAMYATCAMPRCEVRFTRCRIHHVTPWIPTGVTDLNNLVPVCDRHHHKIHEGGWTLTMTPDRVITLRRPDGTTEYVGDTRDRVAAEASPSGDLDEPTRGRPRWERFKPEPDDGRAPPDSLRAAARPDAAHPPAAQAHLRHMTGAVGG